jgi:hypothetical protein
LSFAAWAGRAAPAARKGINAQQYRIDAERRIFPNRTFPQRKALKKFAIELSFLFDTVSKCRILKRQP